MKYLHSGGVDVRLERLIGVREVGQDVRPVGSGGEGAREHSTRGDGGGSGGLVWKPPRAL